MLPKVGCCLHLSMLRVMTQHLPPHAWSTVLMSHAHRHQVEGSTVNGSTNASAVICPSGYVRVSSALGAGRMSDRSQQLLAA